MNRFARECGEFSQCWKRWLHLHLHWFSILSVVIFQLVCQAKLFSKHSQDICKPSCYRWPLGLRTFHVCVCSARLEREMLWRWNTFEQIFFECFDTRSQRKSFWPNKHERLIKQIWKIDQTNMNATADRERSSRFILQSQVASLEAGSIKPEQVIKEALSSLDFQEKTNFSSFNFSRFSTQSLLPWPSSTSPSSLQIWKEECRPTQTTSTPGLARSSRYLGLNKQTIVDIAAEIGYFLHENSCVVSR